MPKYSDMVSLLLVLAVATGCAASPEVEEQQRQQQESIETILKEPLDTEQYGETRRCLNPQEYRDFRVLDDQRILFIGSRDRYWLNTLRMRCFDLRNATVLRVKSISTVGRICDMDTFKPGDWFDWPWYRRWPWHWGSGLDTSMTCSLGKFQPLSAAQVAAIEAALK